MGSPSGHVRLRRRPGRPVLGYLVEAHRASRHGLPAQAAGVQPVGHQRQVDERERRVRREAQPELVVLGAALARVFVEAAVRVEQFAPHDRGRERDEIVKEEAAVEHPRIRHAAQIRRGHPARPLPLFEEVAIPAEHEAGRGIRVEACGLQGELLGQPAVVGVEEGDKFAARFGEAAVPRGGREAGVRGGDRTHARVAEAGGDLARGVGRAVVDDQPLPVAKGLGQDRAPRLAEVRRRVVRRRHDADHERTRRTMSFSAAIASAFSTPNSDGAK